MARAVGVSASTVSNAFNRPDQLSPALRERILDTATELGYPGPDPTARSLRSGRVEAVGVAFYGDLPHVFEDPALVRFMRGVASALTAERLALVLVPGRDDVNAAVSKVAVDGFIAVGLVDRPLLEATLRRQLPTVLIDAHATAGHDFVGIDDRAAASKAVEHLIGLGHRDLGIISFGRFRSPRTPGSDVPEGISGDVNERRLDGSALAIRAAGLEWSAIPVATPPAFTEQGGRAATHALLDRSPGVTALFAFSDQLALGAMLAANDRGLSVPDDLSIVGFDDTAPVSDGLTTIRQPLVEKGHRAARLLIGRLGDDTQAPRLELLTTRLVVRRSTGPVPSATPGPA